MSVTLVELSENTRLISQKVDVCGDVPLICSHLPGSALTLVCLPLIYDSHFNVCGLIQRSSLGWNTTGSKTGVTSHVTKTTGLQGGSIATLETKASIGALKNSCNIYKCEQTLTLKMQH